MRRVLATAVALSVVLSLTATEAFARRGLQVGADRQQARDQSRLSSSQSGVGDRDRNRDNDLSSTLDRLRSRVGDFGDSPTCDPIGDCDRDPLCDPIRDRLGERDCDPTCDPIQDRLRSWDRDPVRNPTSDRNRDRDQDCDEDSVFELFWRWGWGR